MHIIAGVQNYITLHHPRHLVVILLCGSCTKSYGEASPYTEYCYNYVYEVRTKGHIEEKGKNIKHIYIGTCINGLTDQAYT